MKARAHTGVPMDDDRPLLQPPATVRGRSVTVFNPLGPRTRAPSIYELEEREEVHTGGRSPRVMGGPGSSARARRPPQGTHPPDPSVGSG